VKLFKKANSKSYWYDFTVRGRRYRGSTQETKSVRAVKVASVKLASVIEMNDLLPSKPPSVLLTARCFSSSVSDRCAASPSVCHRRTSRPVRRRGDGELARTVARDFDRE
jgi:hypothetical protein